MGRTGRREMLAVSALVRHRTLATHPGGPFPRIIPSVAVGAVIGPGCMQNGQEVWVIIEPGSVRRNLVGVKVDQDCLECEESSAPASAARVRSGVSIGSLRQNTGRLMGPALDASCGRLYSNLEI